MNKTWREIWVGAILSGYYNHGFEMPHQRIMASAIILEADDANDAIARLEEKYKSTGDIFYYSIAYPNRVSLVVSE